MPDAAQLEELLLDWQEARARGQTVSPETLAASAPELLSELRRRIGVLEQMEFFLDVPVPSGLTTAPHDGPPRPPHVALEIPGYEILEELGRGGMGVVYRAVQKSTRRQVALKVLLQGRHASPRQRLRFEREIDLAASLRHPNIVTLFESGSAPDGLGYFAMELVPGRSLADYAASSPGRDQLLRLFHKICAAVNYAHQRGVIHRDLKPGNIRVDDDGEPHILDFGLAKSAASSDDERGLTATGEFVGTIAYASPEQAAGNVEQIDVRTDVYALGAMLYELLTGSLPHPPGPLAAMLRAILEEEPVSPGTRLRQQPGLPASDEFLDAIVLKALARDRQDRYQTAGELAADVSSYLAGGPIRARPPGVASLIWTWLRQNVRVAVRIVAIGIVCGSVSAALAGVPRMLPMMHVHWAVQARLAGGSPDVNFALPEWLMQLLTVLAIIPFAGMGLMLCLLVRPRSRWDDALAGLAAGLVAGLTAFAVCGGWGSVVALAVLPAQFDLDTLSNPDDEHLLAAHPELAAVPADERRFVLRDKIVGEMVAAIPRGIGLGLALTVGAFAAFGVFGALMAGILVERERSVLAALAPYLEATILATGLVLVLYMQAFFSARAAPAALATYALLAGLAPAGIVRGWPWTRRAALYASGFAVIARLTRPDLPWFVDVGVLVVALQVLALSLRSERNPRLGEPGV